MWPWYVVCWFVGGVFSWICSLVIVCSECVGVFGGVCGAGSVLFATSSIGLVSIISIGSGSVFGCRSVGGGGMFGRWIVGVGIFDEYNFD